MKTPRTEGTFMQMRSDRVPCRRSPASGVFRRTFRKTGHRIRIPGFAGTTAHVHPAPVCPRLMAVHRNDPPSAGDGGEPAAQQVRFRSSHLGAWDGSRM
ncbi:hypothetical protein Sfum_3895 [Syntrophobacter fumaroxidans MPOB]|uniref:Uncharacterized protein n=1 Tax=Syntrophobacter fumaroxidans (strain DSM 10017 / MPOB) TaxID=335543 RepID=A0LQ62_SYNFM|nr:hypothetical protein Sfum_3895 [Syntrophobacter fumaroxidans MPOB]